MTKTKKRASAVKDKSPVGKVARVVETKQDVITKAASESDRRTVEMFLANKGEVALPVDDLESHRMRLASKLLDEYAVVKDIPQEASKEKTGEALLQSQQQGDSDAAVPVGVDNVVSKLLAKKIGKDASALVRYKQIGMPEMEKPMSRALSLRRELAKPVEPKWHAPWKLMRVISGHLGWVRSVAVDPTNMFFATGSADRTIKVWDLASGSLKLTLTGHINAVRALEFSERYTYMFSAGEDKLVKCWDLEYNKVIRHYHGHYTGVYALKLHPTLDLLVTGGRDSSARVWDIRSRKQVHLLGGHKGTVHSLLTQGVNPQVVTGSMDGTIKLWDLVAGKVMTTLTNHKKGVRSLVAHPREFTFASGAADNIKKWKFPQGVFMQNLSDHNSIINTLSINDDNVLVSGGNDGTVCFWDWPSGHCFQSTRSQAQPGSLDSEAGILASCFDRSGSRLITCEADKSIKVWKEDETATPETHPLEWKVNENARKY